MSIQRLVWLENQYTSHEIMFIGQIINIYYRSYHKKLPYEGECTGILPVNAAIAGDQVGIALEFGDQPVPHVLVRDSVDIDAEEVGIVDHTAGQVVEFFEQAEVGGGAGNFQANELPEDGLAGVLAEQGFHAILVAGFTISEDHRKTGIFRFGVETAHHGFHGAGHVGATVDRASRHIAFNVAVEILCRDGGKLFDVGTPAPSRHVAVVIQVQTHGENRSGNAVHVALRIEVATVFAHLGRA